MKPITQKLTNTQRRNRNRRQEKLAKQTLGQMAMYAMAVIRTRSKMTRRQAQLAQVRAGLRPAASDNGMGVLPHFQMGNLLVGLAPSF